MSTLPSTAIEFADVSYRVAQATLLDGVSFSAGTGEILILVGRSGSGKTTCLKMVNRLLLPTSGEVLISGTPLQEWDVIKLRRRVGYAIQEVGLFPHFTVRQNVALVPKLEGWEQEKISTRVDEVLSLVGLSSKEFANRYPHELSGGQRQRVGLARALAADPPILLMDEPFGALDPITRSELQLEFKKLQQRLRKTVLFVTHDIGEALLLGSRIGLMEGGRLLGIHTPDEFLRSSDQKIKAYVDVFRAGQRIFQN
jgi:osmoprotectant transport system ATP-binding protein